MKTTRKLLVAIPGLALLALLSFTIGDGLPRNGSETRLMRALGNYESRRERAETTGAATPKSPSLRILSIDCLPILVRWLKEDNAPEPFFQRLRNRIPLPLWVTRPLDSVRADSVTPPNLPFLGLIGFELMGSNAVPALPALVRLLIESPGANPAAASALVCIGPAALPFALDLTRSPDSSQRTKGAYLLGALAIKPEESIPTLLRLTYDTNREVRSWALCGLGEFSGNELDPRLVLLLHDNESALDAAYALSGRSTNAIPLLLGSLASTNRNVRVAALAALSYREYFAKMSFDHEPRYRVYPGKKGAFNSLAHRMAFLLYANPDQEELFSSLRHNYAQTGEPKIEETLKARAHRPSP